MFSLNAVRSRLVYRTNIDAWPQGTRFLTTQHSSSWQLSKRLVCCVRSIAEPLVKALISGCLGFVYWHSLNIFTVCSVVESNSSFIRLCALIRYLMRLLWHSIFINVLSHAFFILIPRTVFNGNKNLIYLIFFTNIICLISQKSIEGSLLCTSVVYITIRFVTSEWRKL